MLTKAQSKYIRSLSQQKYRKEYNLFIAEGEKIAKEWLSTDLPINMIVTTEEWYFENRELISAHTEAELCVVKPHELSAVSSLKTANEVLLVLPQQEQISIDGIDDWCIALDKLQDPGNMGTVIRIADWFGVKHIIMSPDCVDVYNPKVVQAAMGGHIRVQFYEQNMAKFMDKTAMPVYAAVLGGDSIFEFNKPEKGVILIGNESKGLDEVLVEKATHQITIPKLGGAESLNAGVSAGIITALLTHR